MNTRTLTWALGSACLGLALWASALPVGHADSSDHELARQALQQGKVLPCAPYWTRWKRVFWPSG